MFSISNKGSRMLIINDHSYYRRGINARGTVWACKNRLNRNCKATASLEKIDGVEVVKIRNGNHSHPVEEYVRRRAPLKSKSKYSTS